MEPDKTKEKIDLDRIAKLTEENHQMITRLYKAWQWNRVFKIAYIVIIVGAALGVFYFLQPYIDNARNVVKALEQQIINFQENK